MLVLSQILRFCALTLIKILLKLIIHEAILSLRMQNCQTSHLKNTNIHINQPHKMLKGQNSSDGLCGPCGLCGLKLWVVYRN